MFIEVISFGGSIDNKGLTYYVQDELAQDIQIGCLVEVPFRNNVDYAIVTGLDSQEIIENPKSIVRIITRVPLLAPYQIQEIFHIASYYFVHTHQILSLFLSKSLIRYLEKKDFSLLNKPIYQESITQTKNVLDFYHHTSDIPFFQKIHESIKNDMVIIFPDDFSLEAYFQKYPLNSETTLTIPDKLTETKKYKTYCSVYNKEKNIIIGTRRILYYNLSKYKYIIYIEDALHKTAMRFGHTYKHLKILHDISKISHFHIQIFSSLPSIESIYLLHTGVYKGIDI